MRDGDGASSRRLIRKKLQGAFDLEQQSKPKACSAVFVLLLQNRRLTFRFLRQSDCPERGRIALNAEPFFVTARSERT